jgi:hypothetical protein
MYDIVDSILPRRDKRTRQIKAAIVALVRLCKSYLLDGTDPGSLERLAVSHGINLAFNRTTVTGLVPQVLVECANRSSVVDFSDMPWLPVMLGLDFPPCDVLFVDEAQDLDPCQHALVRRIAGEGRLVVIGDPRQAIYGFRGADTRSIETLSGQLSATERGIKTLPLTMTRRCPRLHIELARTIVADFESLPEAPAGEVVEFADVSATLQPGTMALCRVNAPLVGMCYQLVGDARERGLDGREPRRMHRGCRCIGRDLLPEFVGDRPIEGDIAAPGRGIDLADPLDTRGARRTLARPGPGNDDQVRIVTREAIEDCLLLGRWHERRSAPR